MANFIRGANPIWYMPDLVGQPLNDEYFAIFLTNTLPYAPNPVFRDYQANAVWPNAIVQFQEDGTLPNNVFFDDTQVYRIEIRKGFTQEDPLIRLIENYTVGDGTGGGDFSGGGSEIENQFTNPQFSRVFFTNPLKITTAGTYNLAPGWYLDVTGTGSSLTVNQLAIAGTANVTSNPPFALQVNANGWTTINLRQRFKMNGALWAGKNIGVALLGQAEGVTQQISCTYMPNSPGTPVPVFNAALTTAGYAPIVGNAAIDNTSLNTATGNNAYVDIVFGLPGSGIVDLTNFQITADDLPITPEFQEETTERYIDHMFNTYFGSVILQPKNSLVVGWNFRQNPYQFINLTAPMTLGQQPLYVADQTIMAVSTAASINVNIANGSESPPLPANALLARAIPSTTQGQIFWLQYIDGATIRGWWGYNLSVLVRARIFTTLGTQVKLKVRLFTVNSVPGVLSTTDPISGYDTNGNPVFFSAYSPRVSPLDQAYTLQNNYDLLNHNDPVCPSMAYNKIPNAILDSSVNFATLGVMVYTVGTLNAAAGDYIMMESISVVPNDFALDTTPQTFDQVLRQCQYYWEKSYDVTVLSGTANALANAQTTNLPSSTGNISGIDRPFKVAKRGTPLITWFSPVTGTPSRVANLTSGSDLTVTANLNYGMNSTGYMTTSAPAASGSTIAAHWVANSQLGT